MCGQHDKLPDHEEHPEVVKEAAAHVHNVDQHDKLGEVIMEAGDHVHIP